MEAIRNNNQPIMSNEVRFYGIKEVVDLIGWSEKTVQKLFNDPKFPAADYGKTTVVEASALRKFFSERHDRDRELYWR